MHAEIAIICQIQYFYERRPILLFHGMYQNSTRPRQNWTWAQQRNRTYHEAVGAMNERLIAVTVDWPHHGLIVSAWYRHTMSAQEAINFAHGTCTHNNCLAHKAFQKSKWSSKITPSYRSHRQIHFQILPTSQSHPNQSSSSQGKRLVSCFQGKHDGVNKTFSKKTWCSYWK